MVLLYDSNPHILLYKNVKNVISVHFTHFLSQLSKLKWDLDQKEKTMTIFSSLPNLHSHIVLCKILHKC